MSRKRWLRQRWATDARMLFVSRYSPVIIFSCLWEASFVLSWGFTILLESDLCFWCSTGCLWCCWKPPALCSEAGVWSSTVDHRFDFVYPEDAVTSANTTTLCISLSSLRLPYTYQLLRWVLIPSLACLYLAVHTKPKAACPHSINGIAQLFQLFFHMSVLLFSVLHLRWADWSFVHPNLVHLDSAENQSAINLSWNKHVWWALKDGSGERDQGGWKMAVCVVWLYKRCSDSASVRDFVLLCGAKQPACPLPG